MRTGRVGAAGNAGQGERRGTTVLRCGRGDSYTGARPADRHATFLGAVAVTSGYVMTASVQWTERSSIHNIMHRLWKSLNRE